MKEFISRKDIHGTQLREGDIVAECTKNEVIWEGKAIIRERPIGVVTVYSDSKLSPYIPPEETDMYNIIELRSGIVEFTDLATDWLRGPSNAKYGKIHISRYDGNFYAWNNIERIGSIYDLDKFNNNINYSEVN